MALMYAKCISPFTREAFAMKHDSITKENILALINSVDQKYKDKRVFWMKKNQPEVVVKRLLFDQIDRQIIR